MYKPSLNFLGRFKIQTAMDVIKPNYNSKLIDSIAVNAFRKYEWGPSSYYDTVNYSSFVPKFINFLNSTKVCGKNLSNHLLRLFIHFFVNGSNTTCMQ